MEGATILVQKFERQANVWEPQDEGRQGNLRNEEPVLFLGQLYRQNSRVYVPDHAFLNTDFAIWDVFLQAKGDLSPAEAL